MTTNKREDIEPAEGEPEPKVPRNEEVGDGETSQAGQEEKNNNNDSSAPGSEEAGEENGPKKQDKAKSYLSFTGHRHPRIGDGFQVANLPTPSDSNQNNDNNNENGDKKDGSSDNDSKKKDES